MHSLVATWPRRVAWALVVLLLAAGVGLLRLWSTTEAVGSSLSGEQVVLRILALPFLLATVSLVVFTLLARPRASERSESPSLAAVSAPPKPFTACLLGAQWLNPLQRCDYPTQWQLLWTLGAVGPNAGDELLVRDPERYGKPQVLQAVVDADGVKPGAHLTLYLEKLLDQLKDSYFNEPSAFYNTCAEEKRQRRELAGLHVVCALPESIDAEEAGRTVRDRIAAAFALSASDAPSVRVVQGGAGAGLSALSSALDYLRNYPERTAWVLGWDAPDAGPEPQLNDNLVLLVLGGPQLVTNREPLASLGYPAFSSAEDFEAKKDKPPRAVQALLAAFEQAAAKVSRAQFDARFVVHNAGTDSDVLGHLGAALTMELPEFNVVKQSFNSGVFFGDAGACGALVNLALAAAHAHHHGQPALVADTSEPDRPRALMVAPPTRHLALEPGKPWFRARSELHAYLPWWSRPRDQAVPELLGAPT